MENRARASRPSRVSARGGGAAERAAYTALNAKQMALAEERFTALREKNPRDGQAAAGLGYVRMSQGNFSGAISFFEQAEEDGNRSAALERSLRDSRFYYTMQLATAALEQNSLQVAEQEFRAALIIRPSDPTALQGLGGTLLKGQQNEAAAGVFAVFAKAAPGNAAAWRGLFMAQFGAGRPGEALSTGRRIPAAVKKELQHDPDYLRTEASVYLALGRDAEAERVLRAALELPFPRGGAGIGADVQLQYAALLSRGQPQGTGGRPVSAGAGW